MSLTHLYPWQFITKQAGLILTHQFKQTYDVQKLQEDLKAVLNEYKVQSHYRPYLTSGWGAITLAGPNGDPNDHRPYIHKPGDLIHKKTPAMELAPYMESIIDSYPGQKLRARLMCLEPGKDIYWHDDGDEYGLDFNVARLHIPVVTNPKMILQASHEDCNWQEGTVSFLDASFHHRVHNGGTEARVHLVFDLVLNDETRSMFPAEMHDQGPLRMATRPKCRWWHQRTVGQIFRVKKRLAKEKTKWMGKAPVAQKAGTS